MRSPDTAGSQSQIAPAVGTGDEAGFRIAARDGVVALSHARRRSLEAQRLDARLRLVAPILLAAVGGLCLRDYLVSGRTLTALEVALAAVALGSTLLLFRRWSSRSFVIGLEAALIWSSGGYLAARAYDLQNWMVSGAVAGDVIRHLDHTAILLSLLIVGYAVAVPRSLANAVLIVGPLSVAPLGLALLRIARTPEIAERFSVAGMLITDGVLIPASAATIGMYTAYLITSYRRTLDQVKNEGRYHLLYEIGGGGMGEVWLARHHLLARPVALKMIRGERLGDRRHLERAWQRFEREAQVTARLRSPHTVELYDFGYTVDGTLYYVMEYLPGLDLDGIVERYGPLPPERTVYVLLQACDALADAHHNGLVHRDIKPSNIMLCRIGTDYDFVKVLDFGLVKTLAPTPPAEMTVEGVFLGTPAYASPEVASGAQLPDHRSDIYSLGCVAFWLLTGTTVFPNRPPRAMLADHIKTPAPAPSQRSELWVPPELDEIVLRCLAKDPAERYQLVEQLAERLAACPLQSRWNPRRAMRWWQSDDERRSIVDGVEPMPTSFPPLPPRRSRSEKRNDS